MRKIVLFVMFLSEVSFSETLSTIVVGGKTFKDKTSLDQTLTTKEIEDMVTNNGDIPSLLKTNPNVKVIEDKSDPSSIEPAKIEINDAKYYQNAFVIDGLSADSLLDPNSRNRIDDVKGNENDVFLDLDLIEFIKVLDSSISAEYGSFSGGVIDVKLKHPRSTPTGKIKYRYTGDRFAKIHAPTDNSSNSVKPSFSKRSLSVSYSGPINEHSGFVASFSNRQGQKPVKYLDGNKNLKSVSSNFLLKYSRYFDDDAIADIGLMYSPYESTNIVGRYVKNSEYTTKGGGITLNGSYEGSFDEWKFDSDLALKYSENSRDTDTSYMKYWRKTDSKSWGSDTSVGEPVSQEGSWGDIKKTQKSILSKFKLDKNFKNHYLNTGLNVNLVQGNYTRDEELYVYREPQAEPDIRCNGSSVDCVQHEQYFKRRDIYQKEDTDANMLALGYYVEDMYKFSFLDVQLGLRGDYNNYLKNVDIAPRLNTRLHFFEDKTKFFAGANRYYGKSFLAYKLREARTPYKSEYRSKYKDEINSKDIPAGVINSTMWNTSADKGSDVYEFSKLDTPYTDEQMFGFSQAFYNNAIKLKFVKREAKKQFMLHKGERKKYTRPDGEVAYYIQKVASNEGESSSKLYTITLQNIIPIEFFSSVFNYTFTFRRSRSHTNFDTYDTNDDDDENSFYVVYNNDIVDSYVVENYTRPDDFGLFLNFATPGVELFGIRGSLSSSILLSYTPSYMKPNPTGRTTEISPGGVTQTVAVYEDEKMSDQKNIDLKFAFNAKFAKNQRIRISADVLNVLDDVESSTTSYQIGRQFWLGAEYKF